MQTIQLRAWFCESYQRNICSLHRISKKGTIIGKNDPVLSTLNILKVKRPQNLCYRRKKTLLGTICPTCCNHSIVQLMAGSNNGRELFDIMSTDQGKDVIASGYPFPNLNLANLRKTKFILPRNFSLTKFQFHFAWDLPNINTTVNCLHRTQFHLLVKTFEISRQVYL